MRIANSKASRPREERGAWLELDEWSCFGRWMLACCFVMVVADVFADKPLSDVYERVQNVPSLGKFASCVEHLLDSPGRDGFWLCDAPLRELIQAGGLRDVINYELACLVKDANYSPPDSNANRLTLLKNERFTLRARLLSKINCEERPDVIESSGRNVLMALVGPCSLVVDRYVQPAPEPNDVFDSRKKLNQPERVRLGPAETMAIRAGHDIVHVLPPRNPTVAVYLRSPIVSTLVWHYDRATLKPKNAIGADVKAARLDYAAQLLGRVGDASAIPQLLELLEHPVYYVRWSALQSIVRLDGRLGTQLLHKALADSHPQVRASAALALTPLGKSRLSDFIGNSNESYATR